MIYVYSLKHFYTILHIKLFKVIGAQTILAERMNFGKVLLKLNH